MDHPAGLGEGTMIEQIVGALIAVAVALAAAFAYFWGSNWLLDRFLATDNSMPVETVTRRDLRRSSIRPWLFVLPALLFLALYLVYPVIETLRLSLYDKYGLEFVGFSNYAWALSDSGFWQAALNTLGWLIIVPFQSTAIGFVFA